MVIGNQSLDSVFENLASWFNGFLSGIGTTSNTASIHSTKVALTDLLLIHTSIKQSPILSAIETDQVKSLQLGKLLLLTCIARYNYLIGYFSENKPLTKTQREEVSFSLTILLNDYKRADYFLDCAGIKLDYICAIQLELLQRIRFLLAQYHPDWLGFEEMRFHIDRKNRQSKEQGDSYHGELICNEQAYKSCSVDSTVIEKLTARAVEIAQGKSGRKQFIVNVCGQLHAMVFDVSWNRAKEQLEIICIESTQEPVQHLALMLFIAELYSKLIRIEAIAIQAGLQQDPLSCQMYAFVLSKEVSKFSFADLAKAPTIAQPSFYSGGKQMILKPMDPVSWKSVGAALGEKIVLMNQSKAKMAEELKPFYPDPNVLALRMQRWEKWYELDDSVPRSSKEHPRSYIHYRRHALRLMYEGKDLSDLTLEKVLAHTESTSYGQALRRQASGWGALREMRFLLSQKSEVIDEKAGEEERTPLHWAYIKNKLSRVRVLEKKGADQAALDKSKKVPRSYAKKS
jgi:hypothetical protein